MGLDPCERHLVRGRCTLVKILPRALPRIVHESTGFLREFAISHLTSNGCARSRPARAMAPPMSCRVPHRLDSQQGANLPRLVAIMQRLLAPGGCPWDQAQTHQTLRRYVLEEACEVIDAIDRNDVDGLHEELGDLLLQVVFQAELARTAGHFGPDDVVDGISDKLERRHPHVFGDVQVDGPEQVHQNWERIKAEEKRERGVLDGVPRSLPGLARAQRLGQKAARVGFDWPEASGCRDKVTEELRELDAATESGSPDAVREELGDLLFAVANLARHLDVDAELALQDASTKFSRRFRTVEARVRQEHGGFHPDGERLDIGTLETYWQEAKTK